MLQKVNYHTVVSNLLLFSTSFYAFRQQPAEVLKVSPDFRYKFVWASALCGLFDKKRQSPQSRWLHVCAHKTLLLSWLRGPKSCSAHCSRPVQKVFDIAHVGCELSPRSVEQSIQNNAPRTRNFCAGQLFKFMPPDLYADPICTINNCKFIFIAW